MKYITPKEAGEKWGISDRRIQLLCKQGRIEGVYRLGWTWAIPENAKKPADGRTKEQRNFKNKEGFSVISAGILRDGRVGYSKGAEKPTDGRLKKRPD